MLLTGKRARKGFQRIYQAGFHIPAQLSSFLPSPGSIYPSAGILLCPRSRGVPPHSPLTPTFPFNPHIPFNSSIQELPPLWGPGICSELWILPSSALSLFAQSKFEFPHKVTKTHFPLPLLPNSFTSQKQLEELGGGCCLLLPQQSPIHFFVLRCFRA